jgi:hypothetical protein
MLASEMELNLFKFYHLYTAWKHLYIVQVLPSMYCLPASTHFVQALLSMYCLPVSTHIAYIAWQYLNIGVKAVSKCLPA